MVITPSYHLLEISSKLWQATRTYRDFPDDQVNVRVVSENEIRELNKKYRGKDKSTNVLTFNYDGEHDIAVCLEVAQREAKEKGVSEWDYVAWLLVHAFLHATGMDHEKSEEEAREMEQAEREILTKAGHQWYYHGHGSAVE